MKFDEETERVINEAAERAVGIYKEALDDKFSQVLEATNSIQETLKEVVKRDEFNELKAEVHTIRPAVTDTNKDLGRLLKKRVTKLEKASANA